MKQSILAVVLTISVAGFAYAEEPMDVREALDYVSGELSQCAAYYTVVSLSVEGMESEQGQSIGVQSSQSAEATLNAASLFIDREIAYARVRTSAQEMMEQIDGDASRIGLLTADYGQKCKRLMENLADRIVELTR